MRLTLIVWLAAALLLTAVGCGGPPPVAQVPEMAAVAPPMAPGTSDQSMLEEGVKGRPLSPAEVADLSDRLLTDGNPGRNDEKTMARLEILLLKALKSEDKTYRSALWRNLGIIHYQQRKYKRARQELQASNELNPRDARTHYYLARLFAQQGAIYQEQGKARISKQQYKRATIEMEQTRKLAPNNPLYRQDLNKILQQEPK